MPLRRLALRVRDANVVRCLMWLQYTAVPAGKIASGIEENRIEIVMDRYYNGIINGLPMAG